MTRRGVHTEVEMQDGTLFEWPRCEISGCPNAVALLMSRSLCYPHGIELGEFTAEQFEANRKQQHEES